MRSISILVWLVRNWQALSSMMVGGVCAAWLAGLTLLGLNRRHFPVLSEVQPSPPPNTPLPSLSILVPACNEAHTIERAMQSLLALDYPDLEILAINDRSTDATGAILDRLAAQDSRLRVLHITTLPDGWLGKNHALHVAGLEARGEWLLFTDADVVFAPDALRRAVAYADSHDLDHITIAPRCESHGFWERLFQSYFMLLYSLRIRVWEINNPKRSAYAGFGAFNLVRATTYRRVGGHCALRMEVVDDMKLGKILKRGGGRAALLRGHDLLSVRWMVGLKGIVTGLEKNAYAAYDFSLIRMAGSLVGAALFTLLPALMLLSPSPAGRGLAACTFLTMFLGANAVRRTTGVNAFYSLLYPLAALVLIFVVLRSTWRTYRQGGILWRGTLYPLEALRKGVV